MVARANAAWYKDVFGDRYYIELQEHGLEQDKTVTPQLIRLARELGLPTVATNDNHYTTKEEHAKQDLLLCVQTSSTTPEGPTSTCGCPGPSSIGIAL